ncbi:MAG TPA: hypothetical protein DHW71_08845 [Gammaproteobacteria bacterium]|nr:hypothetical protein [Gammaproteobacteria bacterium]
MQKKKKLDYGHEYAVDVESIRGQSLDYSPKNILPRWVVFGLAGAALAVFLIFCDAVMETSRDQHQQLMHKSLMQFELTKSVQNPSINSAFNFAEYSTQQSNDLYSLPDQLGFFSQNSFYLPQFSGVVYVNATNMMGRLFPSIAKRFHVAIILSNDGTFKVPGHSRVLGVQELGYQKLENLGMTFMELEVPADQRQWFSRYMTRTMLEHRSVSFE